MSVDNILAIAGASHGNFWLILFGLAVSIPFIVLSSNLLSRLMDRWPALVYVGSGILGKVGGEMVLTDPVVVAAWRPDELTRWAIEGALAIGLIVFGWGRMRRARAWRVAGRHLSVTRIAPSSLPAAFASSPRKYSSGLRA